MERLAAATTRSLERRKRIAVNPRILGWECVQGVKAYFEGRNGKNRSHLIGDKTFAV